jgi:hypothetical protein
MGGRRDSSRRELILKICVFSSDLKLLDLCLEVVNGLSLDDCEVVRADPESAPTITADLLIWDLEHKAWPLDKLRGLRRRRISCLS